MGEAKRRKATEPLYGKIRDRTSMRGLIISTPAVVDGSRVTFKGALDPEDLRFSLFFWDRLSWPQSAGIAIGSCPSASYLESAGILERPGFFFNGDQTKAHIRGYLSTLEQYERTQPGMWALGSGANSIQGDHSLFTDNNGAIIELQRCIPIPKKDVPLAEILEFRQRRRDELLIFRQYLDDIASEIVSTSDSVDALNRAQKNLDETCRDLIRVTKEWQAPIYLTNFRASFNLDLGKAVSTAFKTWSALGIMGLSGTTAEIGAVAAGINSQISIKSDVAFRQLRRETSPFKYAYSIEREFG